jgi:hypothetical protein
MLRKGYAFYGVHTRHTDVYAKFVKKSIDRLGPRCKVR